MDFIAYDDAEWIHLNQNTEQWRSLMKTV